MYMYTYLNSLSFSSKRSTSSSFAVFSDSFCSRVCCCDEISASKAATSLDISITCPLVPSPPIAVPRPSRRAASSASSTFVVCIYMFMFISYVFYFDKILIYRLAGPKQCESIESHRNKSDIQDTQTNIRVNILVMIVVT